MKSFLVSRIFWVDATERAVKSGAQFVLLTLGFGLVAGTQEDSTAQVVNAFLVDYKTLLGVFLGGVLFSYITSLASAKVSSDNSPSLVK